MKYLLSFLLMILVNVSVNAQDKVNKNARNEMTVNGNCDMCKKRIEKAAYSVKGVKSAKWNADDQKLVYFINEEKTSSEMVASAIAKVGHDTDQVKSTAEDYNSLHGCCLYRTE